MRPDSSTSRQITLVCPVCHASFTRFPSHAKGTLHGRPHCCSVACANVLRVAREPLEAYFWRHVSKTDSCWLWIGGKQGQGYGLISRRDTRLLAHRFSWELHHGSIAEDMVVCHRCDNPICVNPAHLFLGTQKDNVRDMMRKDRHDHDGLELGRGPHPVKLNAAKVRAIRTKYATGMHTQRELAAEYSVSSSTVSRIVRQQSWVHVW